MYYNFHFYLALILNRWWFAVKSLFKLFLAFSNIVHQYSMHHLVIVLLWINTYYITYNSASGLMLVDKVISSILVDYTGVPSIVYTQRISWYIVLICEDYWKGSIKGKKWCTISRTSIKVHWRMKILKKMSTMHEATYT